MDESREKIGKFFLLSVSGEGHTMTHEVQTMEMTREDARELLSRPTYRRFLKAYSTVFDLRSTSHEKLLQEFVSLVAEMEYELFHDWDQASILAHDTLQPICVDFFRERTRGVKILGENVSSLLYRSRLLQNALSEWAAEQSFSLDDEALAMFAWYCHSRYHDWFMDFAPYELHMGGYDWKAEIAAKWALFLQYCNRGGH
ncbi:hypothetical protein [Sphaerochaeta halotolerans]|jgi:hypothetical protein|nr:hypothetical protein [Sphaerochaeta halotolerans]MBG0767935.1 hypothetical protein [Spirochaetaceae bacterium]MXI86123.1 hypothetical protein [Sphaerochaeta halotolerans]